METVAIKRSKYEMFNVRLTDAVAIMYGGELPLWTGKD